MTVPENFEVHIVGGGTIVPVRRHLALSAPAYGTAARQLWRLASDMWPEVIPTLHLTRMADPSSKLITNQDMRQLAHKLVTDPAKKIVVWSPAIVDFDATVKRRRDGFKCFCPPELHDPDFEEQRWFEPPEQRLQSNKEYHLELTTADKLVTMFRRDSVDGQPPRKDIFLVAFKTTAGATEDEMYEAGLRLCKVAAANLVLVNDVVNRVNMVVTPEEARYYTTSNRQEALFGLMSITQARWDADYTPTEVVEGELISPDDERFFPSLRVVTRHCIARGAYKALRGVTAGHFAAKIGPNEFISSRRKVNFNQLDTAGLVRVVTDGPDHVTAFGAKPSAGGQTQRIIFDDHPEMDCIIHFHCPTKPGSSVPVYSQREHECGSHQCGHNTSQGLKAFITPSGKTIKAVQLDKHGPNIVFNHEIDPQEVIDFIEANFDLQAKTGGYQPSMALP